jgi:hypothetical protein
VARKAKSEDGPVDVALVTCSRLPELTEDDQTVVRALEKLGLHAAPAVWDDPNFDWSMPRLSVIRSTWDYHLRHDEFLAWVDRVSALTALWNPPQVIRWNSHKSYLQDLEARGIPIIPTEWLDAGFQVDLDALLTARGWARAVLKPVVSLDAYGTEIVEPAAITTGPTSHRERLLTRNMMLQPYISAVETSGERSLIYIDGHFSHAVRKPSVFEEEPFPGEREYTVVSAAPDEAALAEVALGSVGFDTLYARVDMVRDDSGDLRLMELELVEPSLFFGLVPEAAERMASAIDGRLRARGGS